MEAVVLVCDGLGEACGAPAYKTVTIVAASNGTKASKRRKDLCREDYDLLMKGTRPLMAGKRRA